MKAKCDKVSPVISVIILLAAVELRLTPLSAGGFNLIPDLEVLSYYQDDCNKKD